MRPDETSSEQQAPPEPPRRPRRAGVIALALVGLALTAGISYAASTLVSQPIGLTSEPATVGESLAPGAPATAPATTTTTAPATTTVTTTVTTSPPTTSEPARGDDDRQGEDDDHDDDD
ncbi:MAG TPA: hypothetical protein PKD63_01285 [Solirubrobacteraceae bacterium]|nr:hypothetical protein [Solirubrobacteraceae bacterium]